jgi:hypothetical protein
VVLLSFKLRDPCLHGGYPFQKHFRVQRDWPIRRSLGSNCDIRTAHELVMLSCCILLGSCLRLRLSKAVLNLGEYQTQYDY